MEIKKSMTEEEKNRLNRKTIPLTNSESLTFFFLPFAFFGNTIGKSNDYNESEIERFRTYGFELKIKQAYGLMKFGKLFYLGLFIIAIYFLK